MIVSGVLSGVVGGTGGVGGAVLVGGVHDAAPDPLQTGKERVLVNHKFYQRSNG